MATVREDLVRRVRERIEGELGAMLPPSKLDQITESLTADIVEWLQVIYREHSIEVQAVGDAMPEVMRPSLTWLTEALRS